MGLLKEQRYDTAADVAMRLQKTVVMYKDRPVFVGQGIRTEILGATDLYVDVFDMQGQRWLPERVHSSDEELDIRSKPLGFVNAGDSHGNDALYAARMPRRRQRQGLTEENVYLYYPSYRGPRLGGNNYSPANNDILKSKAFAKMMMNEYPTFEEALKSLAGRKSVAFGRRLMIAKNDIGLTVLHFRTTALGFWDRKKEVFGLTEQFEHYIPLMKQHDVPVVVYD